MRQHTILFYTCTPPGENRQAAEPPTHSHTRKKIIKHTTENQTWDSVHFLTLQTPAALVPTCSLPLGGGAASSKPWRGPNSTFPRCGQQIPAPSTPSRGIASFGVTRGVLCSCLPMLREGAWAATAQLVSAT